MSHVNFKVLNYQLQKNQLNYNDQLYTKVVEFHL